MGCGSSKPKEPVEQPRPTFSSYDCYNGAPWNRKDPDSQTWMYARDRRDQITNFKKPNGGNHGATPFYNRENHVVLTSPGGPVLKPPKLREGETPPTKEWMHFPLIPTNGSKAFRPGKKEEPGGVRAVYTRGDVMNYQVMYHDERLGTTGVSANGKPNGRYALATYHPAIPRPPQAPQPPAPAVRRR